MASILAITWAFSSFLFGAVSDKIGRKPVLVFLVALFMKETAPEATEAQAAQAVS